MNDARSLPDLSRRRNWALVIGLASLLVCVAGAFIVGPAGFFRAWLPAYAFWSGISLGGMAILMIYHLTGGAWGFLLRRVLEAQAMLLPLMAMLFVPVALGVGDLYRWADADQVAANPVIQEQQFYLNPLWFTLRAAAYFAIWLALAWLLSNWSRRQDATGDARLPWKFQRLSEVGLVLYGTTMHFAAFDWLQMLHPTFHSTVFPMLIVAGQLVSALAFALVAFRWIAPPLNESPVLSLRAFNDLGNLQLAFLIVWVYLYWFQFMLIWMANLPYGLDWFLPRRHGIWLPVTWLLIVGHFIVPFFLLLFRGIKCHIRRLAGVAGTLLLMQLTYLFYVVLPAFKTLSWATVWLSFVTPLAIGALYVAGFLSVLSRRSLFPLHDESRERAVHLRELDLEDIEREEALAHA